MKWFTSRKKADIPPEDKEADFFVPRQAVIYGSMETQVPCRIEGSIEGDVFVKGTLIISAGAEVKGNISCDDIEVYGKVWRNIICTRKALIGAGAYVEGTVAADVVEIDEQAIVRQSQPGSA